MGATRGNVVGTVMSEGLITAAIGSILGLVIGHGALAVAVSSFSQLEDLGIDPFQIHPGEILIVAGVLTIGLLAAAIPAIRVFRIDIATTIAKAN